MKISFLDFWQGFDQQNNFLFHLLRSFLEDIEISHPKNADIIFFSCFGKENKNFNHIKKIYYTGENKRPNFSECDFSISFDYNDYNNRNIRIPLWYWFIDWFNVKSYTNPDYLIPTSFLNNYDNLYYLKEKKRFCATVFSAPSDLRFNMVNLLNYYKNIDCFGKIHKLKLPNGEKWKLDIISNYKFSICFENSVTDGYYTEKLLHAKIAGTIPLYNSSLNFKNDFNPNCCLNLENYDNLMEFIDEIKEIDCNKKKYKDLFNEPLFKTIPDLNLVINQIKTIL